MLNCNSQRAEGLQEAFFSPADRIQGSFISQLLVPSVVDTLESSNSSQEIQSQDHQKLGSIHLQGFEDHSLFGPNTHSMGSLDLLTGSSGMSMAMDQGDMKFADMDTWNSLGPGPSIPSTTYRSLLASSGLMDHSSMDYGHHSGSLEQVTCTAMQSPMYHERNTRMDSCRESDSSLSSQSQSFHSSLLPPVGISSTLSRNTALQGGGPGPGSGGLALPIRKGISFDAGLGLNIHHPRFDYNLGQQFMNMETPTFMNHSMESQIHLGTPISLDQAVLCGLPINAYNVGGGGMRLPTEHQGLTHFAQILPSKALKSSPVQFTAPQNFLFGSNLTAAPTGLKLPALNFKCNPPKLEQLSPKLFDGYTASQQSSVCDGRPPKKERHSETYISFRGTKNVVDDHAESTGPIDLFTKNINVMAGSPGIGSLSSEQSTHTSTSPDSVSKRPRLHDQAPAAANLPFKVRKEKLGEKITALQQLVSPFGKTDTASVLLEAIGYIKFLQDQVQLLSTPYMKNVCLPTSTHDIKQQWATDNVKTGGEADLSDLRSKGLCLIPISTIRVANDNGADYWTPTIGGSSR